MSGWSMTWARSRSPAEILSKPTRLSDLEFNLTKAHPQAAYAILRVIEFPWPLAQIVLQHHERMDGSGYPKGLSGEEILMDARILAVANVVEAMASHRPYKASAEPGQGPEGDLGKERDPLRSRGSRCVPEGVLGESVQIRLTVLAQSGLPRAPRPHRLRRSQNRGSPIGCPGPVLYPNTKGYREDSYERTAWNLRYDIGRAGTLLFKIISLGDQAEVVLP